MTAINSYSGHISKIKDQFYKRNNNHYATLKPPNIGTYFLILLSHMVRKNQVI